MNRDTNVDETTCAPSVTDDGSMSSRENTSWIYMLQKMDHTSTERIAHVLQSMSDRMDKLESANVLQTISDKMDILQSVSEKVLHTMVDMNTKLDNIAKNVQSCGTCTQSIQESVTCLEMEINTTATKLCDVDASITELSTMDNNMGFHSVENNIMIKRMQSQVDEIHDMVNNMHTTVVGVIDSKLDETACVVL